MKLNPHQTNLYLYPPPTETDCKDSDASCGARHFANGKFRIYDNVEDFLNSNYVDEGDDRESVCGTIGYCDKRQDLGGMNILQSVMTSEIFWQEFC